VDIKKGETFSHSRRVLEAKRKELKGQGKRNKKNKSEPLDSDEIQKMYETQVLGAGMLGSKCSNFVYESQ
jgi:Na+/citrate or Na+/malate symporter